MTHDGYPQRVAIPCTHEIAAIAGRWRLAETWQDQFLRPVLPSHPTERRAEQLTLAEYQERLTRDKLKRQRDQILQDQASNPTDADESALPANVIVMRRKTA